MIIQVFFLGGIWEKKDEQEIIDNSIGNVQIAANVLQTNLIEGMDAILKAPVTILNEIFIGAFPLKYKKAVIHSGKWNHCSIEGHTDYNIGFLNLPFVKHYNRFNQLKKNIRNVCKECKADIIYFVGYSMTYSVVEGLCYAKIHDQRVKTCLIVPDLPEYMNLGKKKSFAFSFLKTFISNKLYRDIQRIDSFVTLTKYIYEALHVNKPYTVVEGVATVATVLHETKDTHKTKDFVYTGTLAQKYGVVNLVDAFTKVEGDDLRLIICGAGDGKEHILEVADKDHRIQYLGTVSNEVAKKLQREAFVLVNPRSNKEEYTKYSFPSKTMEYMATGRPVLMYKLKGIPDEYDDYIYYFGNDMRKSIEQLAIADPEELAAKGRKARDFVVLNKNSIKQAEKIINLLNSLN